MKWICPCSVQSHFEFIRCICFKITFILKTVVGRVESADIWDPRILICIECILPRVLAYRAHLVHTSSNQIYVDLQISKLKVIISVSFVICREKALWPSIVDLWCRYLSLPYIINAFHAFLERVWYPSCVILVFSINLIVIICQDSGLWRIDTRWDFFQNTDGDMYFDLVSCCLSNCIICPSSPSLAIVLILKSISPTF